VVVTSELGRLLDHKQSSRGPRLDGALAKHYDLRHRNLRPAAYTGRISEHELGGGRLDSHLHSSDDHSHCCCGRADARPPVFPGTVMAIFREMMI